MKTRRGMSDISFLSPVIQKSLISVRSALCSRRSFKFDCYFCASCALLCHGVVHFEWSETEYDARNIKLNGMVWTPARGFIRSDVGRMAHIETISVYWKVMQTNDQNIEHCVVDKRSRMTITALSFPLARFPISHTGLHLYFPTFVIFLSLRLNEKDTWDLLKKKVMKTEILESNKDGSRKTLSAPEERMLGNETNVSETGTEPLRLK